MMRLSELIKKLEEAREEHGDLMCQVWITGHDDPDSDPTSGEFPSFDRIQGSGDDEETLAIDFPLRNL